MKYEIQRTSQFKRDYKLAKKRGCNIQLLKDVITILANGEQLISFNCGKVINSAAFRIYLQ